MTLKWKISLGVLVTLLLVGGGYALAPTIEYHRTAAELPVALEEAKKAGMPLTAADLAIPGQVFATEEEVKFLSQFGFLGDREDLETTFSNLTSTTPDWRKAQKLYSSHKSDLERIRELAARGSVCPKMDFDEGFSIGVPLSAMSAARTLCGHAIFAARSGELETVIRDLKHSRLLAKAFLDSGCLDGLFAGAATERTTFRATETCMEFFTQDSSALKRIRDETLQEMNYDLYRPLRQAFYSQLATVRNLERYGGQDQIAKEEIDPPLPKGQIVRTGIPTDVVSRAYMVKLLKNWTPMISLVRGDKEDMARLLSYARKKSDEAVQPSDVHYRVLYMIQPGGINVGVGGLLADANRRCTVALSYVLEYKSKHGKFPTLLADAGVTLLDPFDHKPLRYRKTESEARIWSTGIDFKDNNGRSTREPRVSDEGSDMVVSFPTLRLREARSQPTSRDRPSALSRPTTKR